MKVIVVADWHGKDIYADVFYRKFLELGWEAVRFSWKEYFQHYQYSSSYPVKKNFLKSVYYKVQNKFTIGPELKKINNDLLATARSEDPNLIFIYRGTHVYPKTIELIKEHTESLVFGYNNDDPFSEGYPKYFWRHFLKCTPRYDHMFCYRKKNIEDYKRIGYVNTSLLRAYYTGERNFLINKSLEGRLYDVVFVGHFENDGRDEWIFQLFGCGYNVKIFGTGWDKSAIYDRLVEVNGDIKPVYDGYNQVLNEAKIALVFLSKLNSDTYTRRCFEIPAAGGMMLSEYSAELGSLFEKGVDADYFTSKQELFDKVAHYLSNPLELEKIASSGRLRLKRDGHEAVDRVKAIVGTYLAVAGERLV